MPLDLTKDVIEAIKSGDLNLVKTLIAEKGVNSKTTTAGRFTLLHTACYSGHIDVVKLLIEKGAELEAADGDNSDTSLHLACRHGHTEIVKFLIEKGAVLEAINDIGFTPLHLACRHGHTELVEFLIKKGADFEVTDSYGCTSLHLTCEFERVLEKQNTNITSYIQIEKLLIRHILLKNQIAKKPIYIQKNVKLSFFWDEQLEKINNLLERKILDQEKVAKIYQKKNTLSYFALCQLLKESRLEDQSDIKGQGQQKLF